MAEELRFDDKVVIVTGAGGGLGRSHALSFGKRGAKVVVNDLGGSAHGEGKSSAMADQVVTEIKEAGGEAVANYDSVEDGAKIVQTALDAFGRIDVVVNNAGILRDVSFHKMTDADWDLVYRVHVRGSYAVTKAAWTHMREQSYGRIIMTASAAGIYGNFGQANYAMAKLGLAGFANTLAVEGRKRNVHVNTIAPLAGSRLTETVLPQELIDALDPSYVSPLVAWLCHEDCEETGGLFEVGGGYFGKLRWERALGKMYRTGRPISVEDVKSSWSTIVDFAKSEHPASINESMQPIMENLQRGPSKGGNEFIDVDEALGYEFPEATSSYGEREVALYALGVGAGTDPLDDKELRLVYEMNGTGFYALPTFGVVPALGVMMENAKKGVSAPGLNYGFDRLLHGEQYTEVKRPLPPKAKLTHRARIKDIFDKGKGALIITAIESLDEDGEVLIYNESTAFIRGAGGWGGERGPSDPGNAAPEREPDAVMKEKIPEHQALLYRLSGDWNPLHADPSFAKAFGFDKPILHGLCTFGYAGRHVITKMAPDSDPRFFKSIKVRFAKNVYPGDTLVTEMWKESDRRIVFRCKVEERDEVVISNAAIELYESIPKKAEKKKVAAAPKAAAAAAPSAPTSADIFGAIGLFLAGSPGTGDKVGHTFKFALSDPASVWTVDVSSGDGSVAEGESKKADCTLELSDSDFMDMCTGKADAQKLYFGGQLKISGNVMASQKLSFLKKVTPELVAQAMAERGGGAAVTEAPAEAGPSEPTSADIFGAIGLFLAGSPGTGNKVGHTFKFALSDPASVWTVDVSSGDGSVAEGESKKADCTLELSDSDFMDMCTGKADAQKLYFGGQLKISGNVMASQKLSFLKKVTPELVAQAMAERGGGGGDAAAADTGPLSADIFAAIGHHVATHADLVGKVGNVFLFKLSDPESAWTLDLKNGAGSVTEGDAGGADCTLEISESDFVDMASGNADAQKLYFGGKLKISGNVMASQKLTFLKDVDRDAAAGAIAEARAKRASGGTAPKAAAKTREAVAPKLFGKLAEASDLVKEIGGKIQLHITNPDAAWVVDGAAGTVGEGEASDAGATLTLTDEDLGSLANDTTAQALFQRGKLRIDGDVALARKIEVISKLD